MANIGQVKQVIGPVVDVSFSGEGSKLPEILNALEIKRPSGETLDPRSTASTWVKTAYVPSRWTLPMV